MHVINKEFNKDTFCYAKIINTTNIYKVDDTKYLISQRRKWPNQLPKLPPAPARSRLIASVMRLGWRPYSNNLGECFMKLFFEQKARRRCVLTGFAVAAAMLGANASAATATGTANATVIVPITVTAGTALNFGTFAANSGGGTVVITTAGARSATGSVALSATTPGVAGSFTVTGNAGSTFAITNPGSFSVTSGANTMAVNLTGLATTGTLASGTATILVPGTLTVGASQAPGSYTGTYTMAVEYN